MYYGITYNGTIVTTQQYSEWLSNDCKFESHPVSFLHITRDNHLCTISCIETDRSFRNRGYAKALIRHIISLLNPKYEIHIPVLKKNEPATQLCKRMGFEVIRVEDDYFHYKYKWNNRPNK